MSLAVTSWFVGQAQQQLSAPRRHFFVGGQDYSDHVLRWPKLQYRAEKVDLGTTAITLSNIDRTFQFFVDSHPTLTTSCELALSFTHPQSGEERISLYQGSPSHVAFGANGMEVRLQLQGKTQRLTDRTLGTEAESGGIDYSNSRYYPADIAWYLVTSHGGMFATQSISNPDLDYQQWVDWRDRNTIRDTRVRAYFAGGKIIQALGSLAFMDSVVISFQGAKLRFRPIFDAYDDEDIPPLAVELASNLRLDIDPQRLTNHFEVSANYQPSAGRFLSTFTEVASDSQAEFGRRSGRFGDTSVWFDTAGDGRYLANDLLRFYSRPLLRLSLDTPLAGGLYRTIGDVLSVTHSLSGIDNEPYRLTRMNIDMARGGLDFQLEPARRRSWQFESFVSSDNLWLHTLSEVSCNTFLVADETIGAHQVHRTDSAGFFQPLDLYATALLPINANEVLFGGPANSGSDQSVIQRSSDSGSSAVVVHTRAAGIDRVYDIFEVKSGTYLASTNSGGILRSSDAGSSWVLTRTISQNYFINRFSAPGGNRIWAGTGYDNVSGIGIHIWESTDEGSSWTAKHTVVVTGNHFVHGFHHLSASEHLLGVWGSDIQSTRTYRSKQTSVSSISWTVVLPETSFHTILETESGHLLMGFDEEYTLNGGMIYRSTDQGSSWFEDYRLAKQGNIRLVDKSEGRIDAFLTRTSAGLRTDKYRNHDPQEMA